MATEEKIVENEEVMDEASNIVMDCANPAIAIGVGIGLVAVAIGGVVIAKRKDISAWWKARKQKKDDAKSIMIKSDSDEEVEE